MQETSPLTLSDADLLDYNSRGLIPGPQETEQDFIARAHYCLNLMEVLQKQSNQEFPISKQDLTSADGCLKEAEEMTKPLYDIAPDWIPFLYSNSKLYPWHGGCAWIFQEKAESPTAAILQLRKQLRNSTVYFGIYPRKELVAHELSHVGRMMFEEPRYEEVLAYRTSQSPFRRWFGPIVQSSSEALLFVLSLVLIAGLDLFVYVYGHYSLYTTLFYFKFIPVILLIFAFYRLWKRQTAFSKCLQNLTETLQNKEKANAVIYRLIDSEIDLIASLTSHQIIDYAKSNSLKNLRWKLLFLLYF